MKSSLCVGAIVLWVVTLAAAGWVFVRGWTEKGTDGRTDQQILQRLSSMTARCTTCHDLYRFGVDK